MALTDALIIVLILLIVYVVVMGDSSPMLKSAWSCVNDNTGEVAKVSVETSSKSAVAVNTAEAKTATENYEYFAQSCIDTDLQPNTDACNCEPGSSFSYAKAEYGPSGDYTTWAMNQTIDPQVAANHKEFISDRTGENSSVNVIGRTYTPADSHQSYTPPNTWWGIRGRPSLVPVCSPDQVNDVNYGYYPTRQKLAWDSTSTYAV